MPELYGVVLMSRHKTGRLPYWVIEIDLFVIQLSVEAMHISIYETDLIYSDASDFPILVGKSIDDTLSFGCCRMVYDHQVKLNVLARFCFVLI